MNLIPTWNELKAFFKVNKKVMVISIAGFLVVFLALFGYNLLSSDSEILEPEYLSQEEVVEILGREPADVTATELDQVEQALAHDRFTFKVLVEKESQDFMSNQNVAKNILAREDVVSLIEGKTGIEIKPTATLAIGVASDSDILRIVIGTGNVEDNEIIANAYFEALTNNELPFFEDKIVFAMDDEPFLEEEKTWFDLAGEQLGELSTTGIILAIVAAIILAIIIAIAVAVLKSIFQKKIPVSYKLEQSSKDNIVYLTKLTSVSEAQYIENLTYAIINPTIKNKLLLSQQVLPTELSQKLAQKTTSGEQAQITISDEVSKINPAYSYEEIVILVKQNQTDKDWYKNQRILVEKLNVPVSVIEF